MELYNNTHIHSSVWSKKDRTEIKQMMKHMSGNKNDYWIKIGLLQSKSSFTSSSSSPSTSTNSSHEQRRIFIVYQRMCQRVFQMTFALLHETLDVKCFGWQQAGFILIRTVALRRYHCDFFLKSKTPKNNGEKSFRSHSSKEVFHFMAFPIFLAFVSIRFSFCKMINDFLAAIPAKIIFIIMHVSKTYKK